MISNVSINIGTGKTYVEDLLSLILKMIPKSKYFIKENTPEIKRNLFKQ